MVKNSGFVAAAALLVLASHLAQAFAPPSPPTQTQRQGNGFATSASMKATPNPHDDGDGDASSSSWRLLLDRRSLVTGGAAAALGTSFVFGALPPPAHATAAAKAASISRKRLARAEAAEAEATRTSRIPTWTLEGGVVMPRLALNTVGLSAEDTTRALTLAFPLGFSHIDFHPGKERDGVAAFLKSSDNPSAIRKKLFLNTKIRKPPPGTSPEDAATMARLQIEDDLSVLGVDSVDMLMLRDSPDCAVIQAQWSVMEEALSQGKTRSVGVINYCQSELACLLETAQVLPATNYYMLHVGMGRDPRGLRSYGESRGIRTFAYGASGEPGPLEKILANPVLKRIGEEHDGRGPDEVALRWTLQTGAAVSVRPTALFGLGTSECEEEDGAFRCADGLKKRAGIFDWSLTEDEMRELDVLKGKGLDQNPTLFSSAGCPDAFVMPKK